MNYGTSILEKTRIKSYTKIQFNSRAPMEKMKQNPSFKTRRYERNFTYLNLFGPYVRWITGGDFIYHMEKIIFIFYWLLLIWRRRCGRERRIRIPCRRRSRKSPSRGTVVVGPHLVTILVVYNDRNLAYVFRESLRCFPGKSERKGEKDELWVGWWQKREKMRKSETWKLAVL